MDKRQQTLSIGYFVVLLAALFALQTFLTAARDETISYSQFKLLVKKDLVSNVVIGEKAIHGEIKPQGIKEAVSPERLKTLGAEITAGKKPLPFVAVRVEDPELVADLEKAGVPFKGEVSNDWLPTVLS